MSRIDDILTGTQTAIIANASFTTAIALRRKELLQDDEFKTLYVFLNIKKSEPSDTPYVCDMRKYSLEVVVKFTLEGRTFDEDVKDPINVLKSTYSDALKTALRTCMPFSTYPIANVYHIEWESEDLEYKEDGARYADMSGRDYRIQQIWNLYTFESITDQMIINIKDRGVATLDANGTVTVLSVEVSTIDRVFLTRTSGVSNQTIIVSAVSAGVSFTITSAGGIDDAGLSIGWLII